MATTTGMGQAEATDRSFILVSYRGTETQGLRPSSPAFPGALARRWIRIGPPGIRPVPIWVATVTGSSLTCYATMS